MAIKMTYDSCLFEEALDEAIKDKMEISGRIQEQEYQKKQWQEEQDRIKEEKLKNEEEYVPEEKEWEPVE